MFIEDPLDLPFMHKNIYVFRRVTRGGRGGGGLPSPFLKIGKKCPNFREKFLCLWSSMC